MLGAVGAEHVAQHRGVLHNLAAGFVLAVQQPQWVRLVAALALAAERLELRRNLALQGLDVLRATRRTADRVQQQSHLFDTQLLEEVQGKKTSVAEAIYLLEPDPDTQILQAPTTYILEEVLVPLMILHIQIFSLEMVAVKKIPADLEMYF